MRLASLALIVSCACGCGRFGFDALGANDDDQTSDGARSDGTSGDAASPCPPGALLCDDFESGDFSKWSSIHSFQPDGTIAVTTTDPHAGARSAEITVPNNPTNNTARALVLSMPTTTTGTIAIRGWFKLVNVMRDYNLIAVLRNEPTGQYVTAGGSPNGNWISSDASAQSVLTDHESASPVPVLGEWFCFEMLFQFAPAPARSSVKLLVDNGVVLDEMIGDASPAYSDVLVGVARADNMGFAVFVDDVAIANSRIGCP